MTDALSVLVMAFAGGVIGFAVVYLLGRSKKR